MNSAGPATIWQHSPGERTSAMALVLLLHAVVIALIMVSRNATLSAAQPGLVAFDVGNDGSPPSQPAARPHPVQARPRSIVAPLPVTPVPLVTVAINPVQSLPDITAIDDALPQEIAGPVGTGCDLSQPVQDALRLDHDVQRQLPSIPSNLRSVANTIMVWNAGWVPPATVPAQAAFDAIRRAIMQTVMSASAGCRNSVQAGPRLIYLPGSAGRTTVLSLGSGKWSWQQLADGNQPLPAGAAGAPIVPVFAVNSAPAPDQTPALSAMLASLIRKRPTAGTPFYP